MKRLVSSLAAAALCAAPALVHAAPPPASDPAANPPSAASPPTPPGAVNPSPNPNSGLPAPSARTGAGSDAAANAGAVISGMSVKDNTGALIGEVKAVKNGLATVQMGSDTFTVDSNRLGVAGGVATINASQAELKKMLPKK